MAILAPSVPTAGLRQRHAELRMPTAGYANANVYGFPKGLENQDSEWFN